MDLPERLRQLRLNHGLTQVQLAHLSQVSLPTIQNIEASKGNPSLSTLEKLLAFFGCTLEVREPSVDWDLLAAYGVPVTSKRPLRLQNRTSEQLAVEVIKALRQDWKAEPKEFRNWEALAALILALQTHYPNVYSRLKPVHAQIAKLLKAADQGRLLKLRRVALSQLQEYL